MEEAVPSERAPAAAAAFAFVAAVAASASAAEGYIPAGAVQGAGHGNQVAQEEVLVVPEPGTHGEGTLRGQDQAKDVLACRLVAVEAVVGRVAGVAEEDVGRR